MADGKKESIGIVWVYESTFKLSYTVCTYINTKLHGHIFVPEKLCHFIFLNFAFLNCFNQFLPVTLELLVIYKGGWLVFVVINNFKALA